MTYVVQRCESLVGLLYLSCLYCVIRGTHSQRRTLWYLGAIACVWIGTGTKEVIATAPVVILLYDRAFLSSSWTNALRARWSLYVALTSSWCWLLGTVGTTLTAETGSAGFNAPVISPMEHLLTQSGVILHYLKLVVWPHPLCLDYYWPIARSTPAIVLSGLLVISLLLTCLWAMARRPALGFLGLSDRPRPARRSGPAQSSRRAIPSTIGTAGSRVRARPRAVRLHSAHGPSKQ